MTWSIIARDPLTGHIGIAVATRFFAVGARVPHIAPGIGGIATQALVNPYYGIDGVRLLREGRSPREVIDTLIATDNGRESRQLHVMDASGHIAAHTGLECIDWCGHIQGDGFSLAGNMLAGAAVLDDTASAYAANAGLPFAQRLIAAMKAGEAAGGDKRGKQSAALLIHGDEEWSDLDLRVDDHTDPLAELERLEQVSRERWVHFRQFMPTRKNPAGITDRTDHRCNHRSRNGGQSMTASPLIEIEGLRVVFHGDDGRTTRAVDSVDLSVANGATLGLVGESGCGKSVTSLAIMGLLSKHSAEVSGSIRFDGFDLLDVPDETLRDLRGNRLAMIFQEPMTSLNPSFTIGDQIIETILRHRGGSRRQARARAIELLRRVHIPSPDKRIDEYPHKLSGGMRQRVMIAMALACDPRLLIADEPTTALDVTLQAQILDLMRELKAASGAAIILITHDLGVVAEVCDEVAVMYAGEIVERAPVDELFADPQHPYTVGLLGSIPRLGRRTAHLATIEGMVPNMANPPSGCRFAARCPFVIESCIAAPPPLVDRESRSRLALHPGAAGAPGVMTALLEVDGLVKHFVAARSVFGRPTAHVKAVDGVSFTVEAGKTLALVGESGCGKSTVSRLVLRLIEADAGSVRFEGRDLGALDANALRAFRRDAQIIFQDPYASLNPRMTVSQILTEPLALHDLVPAAAPARAGRGAVAAGRARAAFCAPLSARIFRRPAPAHRDCAGAGGGAETSHLRRAGLRARRLDPLANPEPAARSAGPAWPRLYLRLPRSRCGEAHRRPGRRDESRLHRRDRGRRGAVRSTTASL